MGNKVLQEEIRQKREEFFRSVGREGVRFEIGDIVCYKEEIYVVRHIEENNIYLNGLNNAIDRFSPELFLERKIENVLAETKVLKTMRENVKRERFQDKIK